MRLLPKEVEIIRSVIHRIFGNVSIYIFGSQLDKNRRGGDIDIFVRTKSTPDKRFKREMARVLLQERLLRPIDIVLEEDANESIKKEALQGVQIG